MAGHKECSTTCSHAVPNAETKKYTDDLAHATEKEKKLESLCRALAQERTLLKKQLAEYKKLVELKKIEKPSTKLKGTNAGKRDTRSAT
jgi:hypothetical protein